MFTKFFPCATQIEASILRMFIGFSYVYLSGQIKNYIWEKNGRFHLRWGCRQNPYDKVADGVVHVHQLAMSKDTKKQLLRADVYVAVCVVPRFASSLTISLNWWECLLLQCICNIMGWVLLALVLFVHQERIRMRR